MRRASFCVLVAAFVLSATHIAAGGHTGSVAGTVFEQNGHPATGAEVMLERSDGSAPLATQTNSEGRFLFKFVLAGYYDIRASRGSAATVWRHNVMVHVGKGTAVNLYLRPIHQHPQSSL